MEITSTSNELAKSSERSLGTQTKDKIKLELTFDELLNLCRGGIRISTKENDLWRGLELIIKGCDIPSTMPHKILGYMSGNIDNKIVIRESFVYLVKKYNKDEKTLLENRDQLSSLAKEELINFFLFRIKYPHMIFI